MDRFSESDPYVRLLLRDPNSGQWVDIGTTEKIDNWANPDFSKTILIDYMFEMQ